MILRKSGISVIQAPDDADTVIVSTAITLTETNKNVIVVGDDTDLMVLLIYHSNKNLHMLRPGSASKPDRFTNISNVQSLLGPIKEVLLFLHAISGCDTTSSKE